MSQRLATAVPRFDTEDEGKANLNGENLMPSLCNLYAFFMQSAVYASERQTQRSDGMD